MSTHWFHYITASLFHFTAMKLRINLSSSIIRLLLFQLISPFLLQHDLKRLWRTWFPCCVLCCPCLQASSLSRDSTIVRQYSKFEQQRHNSSCSEHAMTHRKGSDATKRLLSVNINGYGKYNTELSTQKSLNRSNTYSGHGSDRQVSLWMFENGQTECNSNFTVY